MRTKAIFQGALILAALAGGLGAAEPAAAQSIEEAQQLLRVELGDPESDPQAAFAHTLSALPGRWLMMPWRAFLSAEAAKLAEVCQRTVLVVNADLSAELRYHRKGDEYELPARVAAWQGRFVSLEFDERRYVEEYLAIPPDQINRPVGLTQRNGAHRMMLLTPRGPDLLIGYEIFGGGDATVFHRCAGP